MPAVPVSRIDAGNPGKSTFFDCFGPGDLSDPTVRLRTVAGLGRNATVTGNAYRRAKRVLPDTREEHIAVPKRV